MSVLCQSTGLVKNTLNSKFTFAQQYSCPTTCHLTESVLVTFVIKYKLLAIYIQQSAQFQGNVQSWPFQGKHCVPRGVEQFQQQLKVRFPWRLFRLLKPCLFCHYCQVAVGLHQSSENTATTAALPCTHRARPSQLQAVGFFTRVSFTLNAEMEDWPLQMASR